MATIGDSSQIQPTSSRPQSPQQQNPSDATRSRVTSPKPTVEASDLGGGGDSSSGPSESGNIFISYIVLGVFAASFILVTVALGLLVSLVDNPSCDDQKSIASAMHIDRIKRDLFENNDQLSILKKLLKEPKGSGYRVEYELCPELLQSPVGQPWNSNRLPTNIVPIEYDITLRTPIFATDVYNGEVTIDIEVKQPTQYIILHSKFLSDYLPSVRDQSGAEVQISCTGDFLPNDYYIIKTVQSLTPGNYKVDLFFTGSLVAFSNGIFEISYNSTNNEFQGNMVASHFEPVDARLAFPCFDEPEMKAVFSIRIYHPPTTTALSNMPALSEVPVDEDILTTFQNSPRIPVYLLGMLIFRTEDFGYSEQNTVKGMPIRVWARKQYVDSGSTADPAKMMAEIFNSFDILYNEVPEAIPPKLDVFAIPYYQQDAVGHLGLFIFRENKILYTDSTVQEHTKQKIALEMAKQIATLWFGNYVTFNWWNELWLQESLSDYVKYRAVDRTYPSWRVNEQFITEELINVLLDDSYPSSHPVIKDVNSPEDIDQMFDIVEVSKGAAILRMMEYEIGPIDVYIGLINYLKMNAASGIGNADSLWSVLDNIRDWPASDFADRWLRQANYPLIRARIIQKEDGLYYLSATQERLTSEYSIFSGQEFYPSPYNNEWYIPLTCTFGIRPNDAETYDGQFNIDTKTYEGLIGDGTVAFKWMHCDVSFTGYYLLEYTPDNWDLLADVLKAQNPNLTPLDRSNIIHNLFMNTFTGKTSYNQLARDLTYLKTETDYLPWKTALKHIYDLAGILEYRRSFLQISSYFIDELDGIEGSTDLWAATGDHIEELKREAVLDFSCRMQEVSCLNNATSLWEATFPELTSILSNNLAPHVRAVVYNYHMQNTYNSAEWRYIIGHYDQIQDIQDRELLVDAITYSRLPWILLRFLDEMTNEKKSFSKLNYFDTLSMLARNPLGREITWNYYRANYGNMVTEFGFDDPDIGHTLIDIVKTFSDEFYYFELVKFIEETGDEANSQARQRAIEIVSSNSLWLEYKEEEIIEAFGGNRMNRDGAKAKVDHMNLKKKLRDAYDEKFDVPLIKKKK